MRARLRETASDALDRTDGEAAADERVQLDVAGDAPSGVHHGSTIQGHS